MRNRREMERREEKRVPNKVAVCWCHSYSHIHRVLIRRIVTNSGNKYEFHFLSLLSFSLRFSSLLISSSLSLLFSFLLFSSPPLSSLFPSFLFFLPEVFDRVSWWVAACLANRTLPAPRCVVSCYPEEKRNHIFIVDICHLCCLSSLRLTRATVEQILSLFPSSSRIRRKLINDLIPIPSHLWEFNQVHLRIISFVSGE